MDQGSNPPRSISASSFNSDVVFTNPTRAAANNPHDHPASSSNAEEQGVRRRHTDSTAAVSGHQTPRPAFGDPSGVGDETWREFLTNTTSNVFGGARATADVSRSRYGSARDQNLQGRGDAMSTAPSYFNVANAVAASRKRYASSSDSTDANTHKRSYPGMRPTTPPGPNRPPGAPALNSIDLTNPSASRGVPFGDLQTNSLRPQRTPSTGSIQLPPWQPDSEVLHCPVCKTAFGFWNRKHHCRKCGKVVCDGCSRHRITIPRRYIVQPPAGAASSPFSSTFSALGVSPPSRTFDIPSRISSGPYNGDRSGSNLIDITNSTAEGAEVVRVCNPCVPDPNLSPPPQTPVSSPLGPPPFYTAFGISPQYPAGQPYSSVGGRPPQIPERRGSGLQGFGSSSTNRPSLGYDSEQQLFGRIFPSPLVGTRAIPTSGAPYPPQFLPSRRATLGSSAVGPHNGYHSNYPYRAMGPPQAPSILAHRPSHSAASLPTEPHNQHYGPPHPARFSSHHQPRREIPEEDECPVCGRELPPKCPDGSTKAREKHIEDCIAHHSFSASTPSSSASGATTTAQATSSRPNASNFAADPGAPSTPSATSQTPSFRSDAPTTTLPALPAASSSAGPSSSSAIVPPAQAAQLPTHPQRGNRMILYRASEKDCLGEDGEVQECVICFEEFEPGAEMGRLECLCKFHRLCIRRWWETKGPGSCPTHQLHD